MRNDLNDRVWGIVEGQLHIGHELKIAIDDPEFFTFFECLNMIQTVYLTDNKYLVKLNECVISEIYSMKEAQRILKLDGM